LGFLGAGTGTIPGTAVAVLVVASAVGFGAHRRSRAGGRGERRLSGLCGCLCGAGDRAGRTPAQAAARNGPRRRGPVKALHGERRNVAERHSSGAEPSEIEAAGRVRHVFLLSLD